MAEPQVTAYDMEMFKALGIQYESLPSSVKSVVEVENWPRFSHDNNNVWTFPTDEEVALYVGQLYDIEDDKSKLNGTKPIHLLEVYALAQAWWPIPSIPDFILKTVWGLVPHPLRLKIKTWARSATAQDKKYIAEAITSLVAKGLSIIGIPAIIIRTMLGPVVRLVVDWIVDNVDKLPD
ncbi:hypothetical protein GGS21DRAFT_147303 [Xylaria nigripes]|nr:hypothetical protein GGS21DRAFT_147303 [Xylaria nigripes]